MYETAITLWSVVGMWKPVSPVIAVRCIIPVDFLGTDEMDPDLWSSFGAGTEYSHGSSWLEYDGGEHVIFIILLHLLRKFDISFFWARDHHRFITVINSEERIHAGWRPTETSDQIQSGTVCWGIETEWYLLT